MEDFLENLHLVTSIALILFKRLRVTLVTSITTRAPVGANNKTFGRKKKSKIKMKCQAAVECEWLRWNCVVLTR